VQLLHMSRSLDAAGGFSSMHCILAFRGTHSNA
jgi:hypothetical protein